VIIIERVNLGAMSEEKSGDLYRPGELQLPLAAVAFDMDEGWIACGAAFVHHRRLEAARQGYCMNGLNSGS
jgi:hypothetical protein